VDCTAGDDTLQTTAKDVSSGHQHVLGKTRPEHNKKNSPSAGFGTSPLSTIPRTTPCPITNKRVLAPLPLRT
jgi:hypothetical protein